MIGPADAEHGLARGDRQPHPTHQELLDLLDEPVEAGEAPPYVPAFDARETPRLAGLFGGELRGATVLDVGCNLGLRCFEARLRGATRVMGIDANPDRVSQACALARRLGIEAEFLQMDADEQLPAERFDVVVCADLLQRSRDPFRLLRRLGDATRSCLVIEHPELGSGPVRSLLDVLGVGRLVRRRLMDLPVAVIGRNGPNHRHPEARFYLSRSALIQHLQYHQAGFHTVDSTPAERPGHFTATARRGRIGHLVVLAGASGAGKSTMLQWLRSGAASDLLATVSLHGFESAPSIEAVDYATLPGEFTSRLWLHYDLNRAVRFPAKRFAGDEALHLVRCADRVTFLTLWADPGVILERKYRRRANSQTSEPGLRGRLLHAMVNGLSMLPRRRSPHPVHDPDRGTVEWDRLAHSRPEMMADLYEEWFRFCDSLLAADHVVLDTWGGGSSITSPRELLRTLRGEKMADHVSSPATSIPN
jgi:SAM-dependent methyltransferase